MRAVWVLGALLIAALAFLGYRLRPRDRTVQAPPTEESAPVAPPSVDRSPIAEEVNPRAATRAIAAPAPRRSALPSRFADPDGTGEGATVSEAIDAYRRGKTTVERVKAVQWLMLHAERSEYPLLVDAEARDPEPEVRRAAAMAVTIMGSRFPDLTHR